MGRGRQAGWKGTLRHPVFFPMQVSNAPQLTIRSLKSGGREGGREVVVAGGETTLQPASRAHSAGKYGMKRAEEAKAGRQRGRVTEQWAEVHSKF